MKRNILLLAALLVCWGIQSAMPPRWDNRSIQLGDERKELYLPLLKGKKVGLFSNHSGVNSQGAHILDVLLAEGVEVTTLIGPEHGFRGTADAGAHVSSSTDEKTGLPILSLYDGGKNGPKDEDMKRFDVLVVDIQDVGLRFYTYYVTMLQLMKRCAQTDRKVVILDRPNPNGHYVDGPILDMSLKSGVGALPIPIVHGLTLGELALMAQGEGWCEAACDLTVIPCKGYRHKKMYWISIPPSPNLPDMRSIYLYPSICFFEGTVLSLGRGTEKPFQMYGHPDLKDCTFSFTPQSRPGATNPPLKDQLCKGVDLRDISIREIQKAKKIDMQYIVDAYRKMGQGEAFFGSRSRFFDLLTGRREIQQMILRGASAEEIEASWKEDVEKFLQQRKPYLLYK